VLYQEQISYEYDPAGNRTKMTDPSGSASYAYDPLNQMVAVQKSILGRPYTTEYRYDQAGNITGIRYPGSSTWLEYRYNQTNRLSAIPGLADGTQANPAFAYDPAGNLRTVRLNSGVTSTLTPDKLNRLANVSVTSPRLSNPVLSLTYTHDGEGNILTRNENTYRYDELDRLVYAQVKGIFLDDLSARRGYVPGDFVGDRALDFTTPDSTPVSFDYAASSVGLDVGSSAQARRLVLTKDNPGADTSRLTPNTLDLYGSPDGSTFTRLDPAIYNLKTTQDGLTFEFTTPQALAQLKVHSKFDERGEDGAFTDKATFRNTLGELIKAEQELTQATLEYGYDAAGNRTYERFTKAATHSKDYAYYQNSNRLLTDGKYAFVYDDDGNLIKKGNKFTLAGEEVSFTTEGKGVEYWEYSYNLRNQLSQVRKNGQLVATYAYDGLGLRVSATATITSKTTGQSKTTTRDYVFDLVDRVIYDKVISTAGQLPASEDPETATENSYVFANGVHFAKVEGAIGSAAEVYYYHNDHLGSPMAITDSQGNLAWSQDYLPYGEALNEAATQTKTRFTFTGKELDPATGLMYYNARWYDPDLGRFITEDTYAGDPNEPMKLNKYPYVLDNPLRYTDPTGHDAGFAGIDPSKEHFDEKTGRVEKGRASDKQMQERYADLHERDGRGKSRAELKAEAAKAQKAPQRKTEVYSPPSPRERITTILTGVGYWFAGRSTRTVGKGALTLGLLGTSIDKSAWATWRNAELLKVGFGFEAFGVAAETMGAAKIMEGLGITEGVHVPDPVDTLVQVWDDLAR
jgi:RHS repeat-associated protein